MSAIESLGADEQRLAELGYEQELQRGWSGFSKFAIAFAITGYDTSAHLSEETVTADTAAAPAVG